MLALKILGGVIAFTVAFIFLGTLVGGLSEKHHTGLAFLVLFVGIALLLVLTASYGHAVR